MINSKKDVFIIVAVFALILFLSGITYAFFNYNKTGSENTLVVGDIYMNHTEGTAINLTNMFPESAESARSRNDNTVTISITGKNESDRDIYYKLLLTYGDAVTGRDRIDDEYLRFDLVEILANNEEKYIIYNESFNDIENALLTRDRVDAGTTSTVTRTYRLRMWISDDILISDTDQTATYTTSEYNNLFASVKIMVKGNMQNVYYYSSFEDALVDIEAEEYESDATRSTAKAGIYIDSDDHTTNLVLYDNVGITQYNIVTKAINLNLYNYAINDVSTSTTPVGLEFDGNVTLENGTINARIDNTGHSFYFAFQTVSAVVNNIDFNTSPEISGKYTSISLRLGVNMLIKNSAIDNTTINTTGNVSNRSTVKFVNDQLESQLHVMAYCTTTLEDSYLYTQVKTPGAAYIEENGKLIVNNSTVFGDSPGCYLGTNGAYYKHSIGIYNIGTLIVNSGYVFGTHSGVQTNPGSKTYVYGGTFESTDHGGFYLTHGSSGVAYIESANIGGVDYPSEGQMRPNGRVNSLEYNNVTYNLEEAQVAFYQGGTSSQNGESTYLVNCNIYAEGSEIFVMRSTTPQQNIYLSGTRFTNTKTDQTIRMQNFNTMRMYFGLNNNFGLINKVYNTSSVSFDVAREAGAIIDTNVNYRGIVSPE